MNDPWGAEAAGSPAAVEDEGLLDADEGFVVVGGGGADEAVLAGGLPVAGGGGAVGAGALAGVLWAVAAGEEEPLRVVGLDDGLGREVPWLAARQVHVGDHQQVRVPVPGDLALQVVSHQLLVRRPEAEPHRQNLRRRRHRHCFPHSFFSDSSSATAVFLYNLQFYSIYIFIFTNII